MRFLFLFLLVFLSGIQGTCQNEPSDVHVIAYWKPGDSYNFNVTKIKQKWEGKNAVVNDSLHYAATFTVLSADTDSYNISWRMKNNLFETLQLPELSRKKFSQYEEIVVNYKTNKYGAFEGIENWRSLGQMMNELISETIDVRSADSSIKAEDLRKSLNPLLKVYNSKNGVEQLVFKELLMFHFPLGKQYKKGQVYSYQEKIPVMVNSRPATGSGVLFVRNTNSDEKRFELVQQMKIHPDSANKMIHDYLVQIGMRSQVIDKTIASSTVQVTDDNIFDYFYDPGIPGKIVISRETVIKVLEDNVRQIDRTIIEKISSDAKP